jgi:hypothetical protein
MRAPPARPRARGPAGSMRPRASGGVLVAAVEVGGGGELEMGGFWREKAAVPRMCFWRRGGGREGARRGVADGAPPTGDRRALLFTHALCSRSCA